MIRHSKETDTLDLGEVVGPLGGRLNLVLDSHKYQKPPDCSCGRSYNRHATEYPQLPPALSSWRGVYFRQRYLHPQTGNCDNDGKTFRIGPSGFLSYWSEPLLDSLYVLGLSNTMVSQLFPQDVISRTTVWRRVGDLDQRGLAIHEVLHNKLLHDLNSWDREGHKKEITDFLTMTVNNPPTAGLAVAVRRPIHQLTSRWIDERVLTSQQHPTQGNLSFHLV